MPQGFRHGGGRGGGGSGGGRSGGGGRGGRPGGPPRRFGGAASQGGGHHGPPRPGLPPQPDRSAPLPPLSPELLTPASGVLEVIEKGFGFLRDAAGGYRSRPADPFVPPNLLRDHQLRPGVFVEGAVGPPRTPGSGPPLYRVDRVQGLAPAEWAKVRRFEDGTVVTPATRLRLETDPDRFTTRIVDLLIPIGKGSRGIIVAPPRTGKTILLEHMADSILRNHPEAHVMLLLVDERPEEVTHFRRALPKAEVAASSNDEPGENHIRIARLTLARAKRIVEAGKDVVIFLDSITRLTRAFNREMETTGRTMSGGIDARATEEPRAIFGAARTIEEGGSLTIIATALVDTGSRMDDLIFREFKGTGNLEIVLDKELADRRIWPAINVLESGTRHEEKLIPPADLERIHRVRRVLVDRKPVEAMEALLAQLKAHPTNAQFLAQV